VRNHAADPYLIAAALSSVTDHNLAEVLDTALDAQATPELTKQLTALVCTMDGGRQIDVVLKKATAATDGHYAPWQLACVAEYLELKGKGDTHEQKFEAVFADARKNATSAEAPLQERIAAVTLLGRESANQADDIAKLVALLTPSQPADLQTAALTALSRMNDDRVAGLLLDGWKAQSPSVKADILEMMLGQEVWARALLERMEKGTLPANQIDAARRQRLLTHKAAEIRNRAEKLFAGEGSGDRQKLVRDYESVTATAGDKTRGKAVFAKTCSICHQLEGVGHQVGPDLAQVANKSPLYLLTEILDPNRNVDSRFIEYQAALKNGRTVTGLLATETSNNITLRGQEGKEQTILRSEIELLTSTGRSLMPEGLEKDLPKPVLADLLAYLTALRLSPKKFPGNQPETIRAENGQFILPATSCQIFGKEIDFEPDLKNVGMWRGEQDHIIWTLTNDAPAELDVYLDYSCSDASAGNRFVLEGAEPVLRGTVEGTGAWNKYRQIRIGTINLSAGPHTLIFRPDGALVREALLDLRCVYLVPKGKGLKN
jgi:putative heme-binding domain-containing protein